VIHVESYADALPQPGPRPAPPVALNLSDGVLRGTQDLLRAHSDGCRESLVFWAGRATPTGAMITHVIAPDTEAHYDQLDVPSAARAEMALFLRRERLLVFADLHTHPGEAFLSIADRIRPFSTLPGFYAIVIPEFAEGEVGVGWRCYTYTGTDWKETNCAQCLSPWPG
jgi:proteasome lid subunit RPN8/RPN11